MTKTPPTKQELADENIRLAAELVTMQQWINDCQSGMYINCVYCGHRYGPEDKVPATMALALKEHIAICPKHPMSGLLKAAIAAEKALLSLQAVREGLSDELLTSVLDAISAAIKAARDPAS